ncbi:MAG: response regulator [Lachnospiraceae bacterium]|nr:response regulator [Lachnospiraceae bacterium]
MNDIRKERLLLVISTLAALSCVLQNFFGGWEFWVPPLVVAGIIGCWWCHIAQRLNPDSRASMYFLFDAFLLFYHGIHDTSLYEISISTMLFIGTFTILDRISILNLIMIEYTIVMVIQFVFLYQNGTIHDLDAFNTMRIIYHVGGVLNLYIFSRITVSRRVAERKRQEEWQKEVEDSHHDVEDFLSNISHELRTPINVINGMTTILQKDDDREGLDSIRDAGIRLAHQIEDIQDYTELKRGELAMEEESFMCISLVNDIVTYFNANEKRRDLELIVDLDPQTPTLLKGDIKKLHKVFRHLLENAIKFTRKGGVYIKVFSAPQKYGVNLMIEVTDTGVGMTRVDMAQVSKGMYQANKKRNRSTGGIGIGLPIVYGFVHKMGGFVKIRSKKGRGTTVRMTIPMKVVDPAPCLSIRDEAKDGTVFYIKPEKYKVPAIRDYNRSMAVDLATGLKAKLYSAGDPRELERLINELPITYIFTGQEEYEQDHELLDQLARDGYKVVVSANAGFAATQESGILVMPKPLYGFPVVRILNGDIESFEQQAEEKPMFTGVRALVVDDEPMNLVVATGLFKEYGMIVDTAESGKESIEKYESGDYEVVFMDHMMPEMDGVEAMKRIRGVAEASFRHPVVVALTANALSGAREMFLREGFDGFIAKPIDIGEFERVMKRVLPDEMISYEGRDER